MKCPRCGGSDRRSIGVGLWKCQTVRDDYGYAPVPGATGFPVPLEPHIEQHVCGYEYQDSTGIPMLLGLCECGQLAVAKCTKCDVVMCFTHQRKANGRVVCPKHLLEAQERAEERHQRYIQGLQEEADRSRQEFEQQTPGFPYPPGLKSQTYMQRVEALSGPHNIDGVPIERLVRILRSEVPDRMVRVTLRKATGLFSPTKRAVGWAFSKRIATRFSTEVQHDLSQTHDLETKWLITPEGRFWSVQHNVEKSRASDITDFNFAREGSPTVVWGVVFIVREHLLKWRRGIH